MKRMIGKLHRAVFNKKIAIAIAGVLAVGTLAAAPAPAHADDFKFDIRIGNDRSPKRVWVEPVYRTVSERVWIEPVFETRCDRVWIEERVVQWSEVTYGSGPWAKTRKVPYRVEPGRWEERETQVQVYPGRWEERTRTELVREGYWKEIDRGGSSIRIGGGWDDDDRHDHRHGNDRGRWDRDDNRHDRHDRDDDRRSGRRW